jgi:pimeloyl-ACP methyl ester carboxylesterase
LTDFVLPVTRYALSGDVNIAYQTMGAGPVDIIMVPGIVSHVEFMHELPGYTAFLRRLSTFARVVTFDKRGQGLSDRISGAPSLEQRMDDVRAIMEAISSQRAIVFGHSEGCPMSALFAATYPERVSQLILFGGVVHAAMLPNDLNDREERRAQFLKIWLKTLGPSQATNQECNSRLTRQSLNSCATSTPRMTRFGPPPRRSRRADASYFPVSDPTPQSADSATTAE